MPENIDLLPREPTIVDLDLSIEQIPTKPFCQTCMDNCQPYFLFQTYAALSRHRREFHGLGTYTPPPWGPMEIYIREENGRETVCTSADLRRWLKQEQTYCSIPVEARTIPQCLPTKTARLRTEPQEYRGAA